MCLTNQNFPLLATNSIRIMRNGQSLLLSPKYYAIVFCFVSSSIAEALVCLAISKMRKISYRITVLVSTTKDLVGLVNLTSERTKRITPKTRGGMCNHWYKLQPQLTCVVWHFQGRKGFGRQPAQARRKCCSPQSPGLEQTGHCYSLVNKIIV